MTLPEDDNPTVPDPGDQDPTPTDPGLDDDGASSSKAGSSSGVSCSSGTRSYVSTNSVAKTAVYHVENSSFSGNSGGDTIRKRHTLYLDGVKVTAQTKNNGTTGASSSTWDTDSNSQSDYTVTCDDNTYSWRAIARNDTTGVAINGTLYYFKSHSVAATASAPDTPSGANLEANAAYLSCDFYPNTRHSTCTAQLQYKLASAGSWTNAGSSATSNGYSQQTIGRQVTGLTQNTAYHVRLVLTRDSVDNTSLTSATTGFTTLDGTPTVTDLAANAIGITSANLRATVDHNSKDGTLSWRYHTSNPGTPDDTTGTEVSYGTVTADGTYDKTTGTLSADTTYYYWPIYEYDGGTKIYGSIRSLTTQADPGAEAAEGEMLPIQDFDRKWGVATTIFFTVPQDAGTSSDLLYDGAAVWGTGETKITGVVYDDDSTPTITAEANTTSNPARVASTPLYRLDLTAAEMSHDELFITLTNAGTSVRDIMLRVRTHLMLGTVDVDAATGTKTNATAVKMTGYGSGDGLACTSGATGQDIQGVMGSHILNEGTVDNNVSGTVTELDNTTASASGDFYNGAIMLLTGGTGAGQARVIVDYSTGYQVTLQKSWTVNPDATTTYIILPGPDTWTVTPGAELSALPTYSSGYGDFIQFLFQRFVYKRTQTATLFTTFKDDGSTGLATGAVDDDGTTQTHNELA